MIKIDKFIFPMDFIILDIEHVSNPSNYVPIILGRLFLDIANAVIHCQKRIMKISFGNKAVKLNVFDVSKQPPDNDDICEVNMIESLIENTWMQFHSENIVETCLAHFGDNFD